MAQILHWCTTGALHYYNIMHLILVVYCATPPSFQFLQVGEGFLFLKFQTTWRVHVVAWLEVVFLLQTKYNPSTYSKHEMNTPLKTQETYALVLANNTHTDCLTSIIDHLDLLQAISRHFTTQSKHNSGKTTKYKSGKIQVWQNTNVTKYKSDKIQKYQI